MLKFIRDCWFGILLYFFVIILLLYLIIICIAPHNDLKMRGFTMCTYELGYDLSVKDNQLSDVFGIIMRGQICYLGIIGDGFNNWLAGIQKTPWENYLFHDEYEISEEEGEPFSEDLLKANRLN